MILFRALKKIFNTHMLMCEWEGGVPVPRHMSGSQTTTFKTLFSPSTGGFWRSNAGGWT